jgi:hypothetical protein
MYKVVSAKWSAANVAAVFTDYEATVRAWFKETMVAQARSAGAPTPVLAAALAADV